MKSKQFISGLIVGTMVAGTVGVFASGDLISATRTNDTNIYVDGEKLELEDGYEVLNYDGHVYTSTRAVAEALGAKVDFKVVGNEKQVLITPPRDLTEVETVTPEIPVVEEPVEPEIPEDKVDYRLPPVKGSALGLSVLVKSANTPDNETLLSIEVTNNNNEGESMFEYHKFKLVDEKGNEYPVIQETSSDNTMFFASIPNNSEDLRENLRFRKVPANTKVTLIMPLNRYNVNGTITKANIEIPLIIEEYDVSSSSN